MVKKYTKKKFRNLRVFFLFTSSKSTIVAHFKTYSSSIFKDSIAFEKVIGQKVTGGNEIKRLTNLYLSAVFFRRNKAIIKNLVENLFISLVLIAALAIPFITISFILKAPFHWWQNLITYVLSYALTGVNALLISRLITFVDNFQVKVGKPITELVGYFLLVSFTLELLILNWFDSILLKAVIVSSLLIIYGVVTLVILKFIFDNIVDLIFYSKKIQMTNALILEAAYGLRKMRWDEIIRDHLQRQKAIDEVERLASLIEIDYNSHIKARDKKLTKWKTETLKGIAEGLRNLKREIMIPTSSAVAELNKKFDEVFSKVAVNDIFGLAGHEVPASRVRKKSLVDFIKSFIVALSPLTIMILLKVYPVIELPHNYIQIGFFVTGLWALISLLIWFDPNLADKIATIKSANSLLKSNSTDK